MSRKQIIFRADSSLEIGTGHIMRCLSLADALAKKGAQCLFLGRDLPGNIASLIAERGHELICLTAPSHRAETHQPGDLAHASWLGVSWQEDARECAAHIKNLRSHWLIIDHYGLDYRWQEIIKPFAHKLMVIDDLADRKHLADVLLDQNLGRSAQDYAGLVPQDCELRIGPAYALLRPEFSQLRATSMARRQHAPVQQVMISLGGIDKQNMAGRVLTALGQLELPEALIFNIVAGPTAPWLDELRKQAEGFIRPCKVYSGIKDMAHFMADMDFAIGACGTSSWERACLGLPTLGLILAENQIAGAKAMAQAGIALLLDDTDLAESLRTGLEKMLDQQSRLQMAQQAASLTDGLGAPNLAEWMLASI